MKRFIAAAEEGVTLFELLAIGFILALFALAGYGMARSAPATANRTSSLQRWVTIMDKTREQAANAGALVTVAAATDGGSTVTVYSGWSTATQISTYSVPVTMGLEDVSQTSASNAFTFYVRRNGSWYALLGATTIPCTDTMLVGAYGGTTSVGADGYTITCAVFAATPVES